MPAIFIWLVRLAIWTFPLLLEQLLSLLLDASPFKATCGWDWSISYLYTTGFWRDVTGGCVFEKK